MVLDAPPVPAKSAATARSGDPRRLATFVAIAFALTSLGVLAAPRSTLAWSANEFSSASESQLVSLTNQARAAAGLRTLKLDAKLTSIARSRSKDMIARDYFSHTILGKGYTVFHVLDLAGYCYSIAGENIGWNTYPDDVATSTIQRQFMDSPGHRANILGKAWDVVGVGAYKGPDGKKMWTVLFADRCGSTAPKPTPKPTSTPKPKPKPTPAPTRTPKPKPDPTPKPESTPAPTPTPSPEPTTTSEPESSFESGLGLGPGGNGFGNGGEGGDEASTRNVRDADPSSNEGSLRVSDPSTSPGLFETVVGGVTGFFFGQ